MAYFFQKAIVFTLGITALTCCSGRDFYVTKMEFDELRAESDASLCRIGYEDTTPTRIYTELTRRDLIHARFGRQIMEGVVTQGMTWCEVILSWGEPTSRSHEITDKKDNEVMEYSVLTQRGSVVYHRVRLSDGIVTEIIKTGSTVSLRREVN